VRDALDRYRVTRQVWGLWHAVRCGLTYRSDTEGLAGRGVIGHVPIHALSSHAIIPSTTARNVVAMNRLRRLNRSGHRSRRNIVRKPAVRTRNQYGTTTTVPNNNEANENPMDRQKSLVGEIWVGSEANG
jgi:hypothetical protein